MTTQGLDKRILKKVNNIGADSLNILKVILGDTGEDTIEADAAFAAKVHEFVVDPRNIWLKINGKYVRQDEEAELQRQQELERLSLIINKDPHTTGGLITRAINSFRRAAYRGQGIIEVYNAEHEEDPIVLTLKQEASLEG